MSFLLKHIRKIILTFSFILAVFILLFWRSYVESPDLQKIRLAQTYALTSTVYLYLALIASPLYQLFPNLPFKSLHLVARRAIGVSAFFFALIHATIAFLGLLGGFSALPYLPSKYLIAITLSFTALLILSAMAATSFNFMVRKLGKNWKRLHRFVYLATTLIVIHALLLGSHFQDLSGFIPQLFFIALFFLLLLELIRFDKFINSKFPTIARFVTFSIGFAILCVAAFYLIFLRFIPGGSTPSLGIHSQHIQLAKQAQSTQNISSNIPSLTGDKTKRFNVDFDHSASLRAGQKINLKFRVYDSSNGSPVSLFSTPYEKTFHLIIVDDKLEYFKHIHPVQRDTEFAIETSFPNEAVYHIYADFQPVGAIEQQFAFTLKVGNKIGKSTQEPDKNLTKTFGDYEVTLSSQTPLKAAEMSVGSQKLSFTINDAGDGDPIKNLKPYLNSFGHLVMIKQDTYDYLHVHPYAVGSPAKDSSGGPNVEFLPIGIYGPFKAGIYRVFGQFNPNGKLFVSDFTVKVE